MDVPVTVFACTATEACTSAVESESASPAARVRCMLLN
jgi:hypothetical protein